MGNWREKAQASLGAAWQYGEDRCADLDQKIKKLTVGQRMAILGVYAAIAGTLLAVVAALETHNKPNEDDASQKQSAPYEPIGE